MKSVPGELKIGTLFVVQLVFMIVCWEATFLLCKSDMYIFVTDYVHFLLKLYRLAMILGRFISQF